MAGETQTVQAAPIGGEFGISVELNTIDDVVAYEEGRVRPMHGYPRFVPHRVVTAREEEARVSTGFPYALAFPSRRQALFILADYLHRHEAGVPSFSIDGAIDDLLAGLHPGRRPGPSRFSLAPAFELVDAGGLAVVCIDNKQAHERLHLLRRVWGSGFDVHALAGKPAAEAPGFGEEQLCDDLRLLEGARAQGALLFQSGMAAITTILLAAVSLKRRLILIGPAYVDTGTIASQWAAEIPGLSIAWLPGDVTPEALEAELKNGPAIVFFEAPTNPLLTVPDVDAIRGAARRHGAIIGADATIATPYNWRPLDAGLDFVMHSTSKFLSGRYDHLGGLVVTRSTELHALLKTIRDALDFAMPRNQMRLLHKNLKGFPARMAAINAGAKEIAARLKASSAVAMVFYPGSASEGEERVAASLFSPGRSGLLSFKLKDGSRAALVKFYDAVGLPVRKGLGLGGESTLLCPYVMIAHYRADDAFLRARGLDRHLLRLSVGTEPADDIWRGLGLP